jgi:flagellin
LMAQAAASSVNKEMEASMERLATGKRINGASDDAAGVAIASRLTSEIRGTNQAIRNAMDGQALIDTAEGAHQEVETILQRMRELAVQASNDTNDANDRANLQLEMDQLSTEIDRISSTTSWAGQALMDGTGSFTFQVGSHTTAADSIAASLDAMSTAGLGIGAGGTTTAANAATIAEVGNNVIQVGGTPAAGDIFHFTVGSENMAVRIDAMAADLSATDVAAQTNGSSITFDGTDTLTVTAATGTDEFNFTINGVTLEVAMTSGNATATAGELATAINNSQLNINVTDNSDGTLTIAPQTAYSVSTDGGTTFASQTAVNVNGAAGVAEAIETEIDDLVATKLLGLVTTAGSDGSVTLDQQINFSSASTDVAAGATAVGTVNSTGTVLTLETTSITTADTLTFDLNGETVAYTVGADDYEDSVAGTVAALQASVDGNAKFSGMDITVAASGTDITVTAAAKTTTLIQDVSAVASSTTTATTGLSVATSTGAQSAIDALDTAITTVNSQRATLGAISNRLDSTVSNLTNISSNLQAGRGRIEDADFAAETTSLAKSQILQQASTAMLAQANASKQNVLSLLQG